MITSITFKKDFRTFKEGDTFDFKPGVNILVGDQGCGKSTLIELIRWFSTKRQMLVDKKQTSDGSWRADSLGHNFKSEEYVEIAFSSENTEVFAVDFERESVRGSSEILFHMFNEQMRGMRSSHGQGNEALLGWVIDKIKVSKAGTVLLDEPDSSMSPRTCYNLIQIFNAIHTKWDKQVIVSAHNPLIIKGEYPLLHKEPLWTEVLSIEDKTWESPEMFLLKQMCPRQRD